ncbi:cytochrome P450 [Mycena metata]|uniref:Cytochrome P450 n=1 Tax=Mycena metata TaxID=1033252 RepID=A0AAD7MR44_9AGAR|nr:cytochrome P450 [Mycena metata]
MALYPAVQREAQAGIYHVLSNGTVPQLSDRLSLPYVDSECMMWEVLRWKPLAPLGLPHLLTKHDVYKDCYLPSGSIILVNIWSILQDLRMFPHPEMFNPSRFLDDKKALEIVDCIFGFGRRACPGVNFAESSMFIAIAIALSQYCNAAYPTPLTFKGKRSRTMSSIGLGQ